MTLLDGLVAVVKRDCPTCTLVVPVLTELANDRSTPLTVLTQDDPTFPSGLDAVDDTDLTVSLALGIETVPTLLRVVDGVETDRVVGWSREQWEALTGRTHLGVDLPPHRPGCGSRTHDPDVLAARTSATRRCAAAVASGRARGERGRDRGDVRAWVERRASPGPADARARRAHARRDDPRRPRHRRRRAARPRRVQRREGRDQRGARRVPARVSPRRARRGRGGVHRRVQHPRGAGDDDAGRPDRGRERARGPTRSG